MRCVRVAHAPKIASCGFGRIHFNSILTGYATKKAASILAKAALFLVTMSFLHYTTQIEFDCLISGYGVFVEVFVTLR